MAMKKYVTTTPSADAREGRMKTAAAVNKAKVKRTTGTADSKTRRSTAGVEKYGVAARNKGTGPDYQYHVTGSRTTRPNAGKRISEKRSESGVVQEYFSSAPNDSQFVAVKSRRNTSDAIVKPTIKKKASTRPTQARAKKK